MSNHYITSLLTNNGICDNIYKSIVKERNF